MEDLEERGLKIYNAIFRGEKKVEIDELDYKILDILAKDVAECRPAIITIFSLKAEGQLLIC